MVPFVEFDSVMAFDHLHQVGSHRHPRLHSPVFNSDRKTMFLTPSLSMAAK